MNNKILFIVTGIFVIAILSAIIWFLFFAQKQPITTPPDTSVTLPSSGPVPVVIATSTTGVNGSGTIAVGTLGGGTLVTMDFTHNGVTIPDTTNKGRYLLAGDLGYCVTDSSACQAGAESRFNIVYDSNYGSFTIALLVEPLGQTRRAAEQFLMTTLGIGQKDMCRLNYYVGTTVGINETYSTKNLGFSFCPGATPLPL
ncbi:MAG: hypothetical protein AAB442_02470 [Patescibacteria group bacterium]|mgnify:CR=1 FL=1